MKEVVFKQLFYYPKYEFQMFTIYF